MCVTEEEMRRRYEQKSVAERRKFLESLNWAYRRDPGLTRGNKLLPKKNVSDEDMMRNLGEAMRQLQGRSPTVKKNATLENVDMMEVDHSEPTVSTSQNSHIFRHDFAQLSPHF